MKIGVLGALGSVGSRHARNLSDLGHEVHIHDTALPNSAREYVIEESDAMVIATPTPCHFLDLWDCMAAGKPTFVEKPIAATEEEYNKLEGMLGLDQVFVGYNARFHPCVRRAKDMLEEGLIGEPLCAAFTCAQFNAKSDYLRDGVILNWSHEIDLARHLLGECELMAAVIHLVAPIAPHDDHGRDDMADLYLIHGTKIRSTVHLNYITSPQVRGFQLVGAGGGFAVDLAHNVIEHGYDNRTHTVFGRSAWDQTYIDEIQAFVAHAEGRPAPGARGSDGLAVLDLCLSARRIGGLS